MNKLLVILGPTACGKTDLALQLASKFQGELISCDSRQVYKGLDIGTGKISNLKSQISNIQKKKGFWKIDGVRIWMYDVVSPKTQYSVANYVKDADKIIEDIKKREKLPIIVGGTGLYLKALIYGLSNLTLPVDLKLRKRLEKLSKSELQKKLAEISLKRWNSMNNSDRQNPRRLIRAIEITTLSLRKAKPRSSPDMRLPHPSRARDVLKIGLTAPREVLYKMVDDHVVSRVKQGMLEEAEVLHKKGLTINRMKQLGLEYGILADYLEGKIKDKKTLITTLKNKIHGYVRRQLTWFKKEKNVVWFDIKDRNFPKNVEKLVAKWYHPI